MSVVLLGNSSAKEARTVPVLKSGKPVLDDDGHPVTEVSHVPLPGRHITSVTIPDSYSLIEAISVVVAPDGAWNHHSESDSASDSTPDWVESDNTGLEALLAEHFGCPAGRPPGWHEDADVPAAPEAEEATT